MTTKINGRTPEEIKNGLEYCKSGSCDGCLYYESCYSANEMVCEKLNSDALAYIQQLEEKVALYDEAVADAEQLQRERDAAVKDLQSVVASNYFDGDYCKLCKYKEPDGQCHHRCIPYSSEWGWEWRGVQEVE